MQSFEVKSRILRISDEYSIRFTSLVSHATRQFSIELPEAWGSPIVQSLSGSRGLVFPSRCSWRAASAARSSFGLGVRSLIISSQRRSSLSRKITSTSASSVTGAFSCNSTLPPLNLPLITFTITIIIHLWLPNQQREYPLTTVELLQPREEGDGFGYLRFRDHWTLFEPL